MGNILVKGRIPYFSTHVVVTGTSLTATTIISHPSVSFGLSEELFHELVIGGWLLMLRRNGPVAPPRRRNLLSLDGQLMATQSLGPTIPIMENLLSLVVHQVVMINARQTLLTSVMVWY